MGNRFADLPADHAAAFPVCFLFPELPAPGPLRHLSHPAARLLDRPGRGPHSASFRQRKKAVHVLRPPGYLAPDVCGIPPDSSPRNDPLTA